MQPGGHVLSQFILARRRRSRAALRPVMLALEKGYRRRGRERSTLRWPSRFCASRVSSGEAAGASVALLASYVLVGMVVQFEEQ